MSRSIRFVALRIIPVVAGLVLLAASPVPVAGARETGAAARPGGGPASVG